MSCEFYKNGYCKNFEMKVSRDDCEQCSEREYDPEFDDDGYEDDFTDVCDDNGGLLI